MKLTRAKCETGALLICIVTAMESGWKLGSRFDKYGYSHAEDVVPVVYCERFVQIAQRELQAMRRQILRAVPTCPDKVILYTIHILGKISVNHENVQPAHGQPYMIWSFGLRLFILGCPLGLYRRSRCSIIIILTGRRF